MGIEDRIEELQEKLEDTPVNKATEKERARLKSRIADLKEEKRKKAKGTGDTSGYAVKQHGDATVALVGFPSVGKSTLLNQLTNADSETGAYEFTTLEVNPGMLKYRGAEIQILDVPGLIGGAAEGRGDGTQVLSVVRSADIVAVVLDPKEMRENQILSELREAGIRMNSEPPRMKVQKKDRGGIRVSSTVETSLEEETLVEVLQQEGYVNADVTLREEMDLDRFIDGLKGNRRYMPGIRIVNKADKLDKKERQELQSDYLLVSAENGKGAEELKEAIFDKLELLRIYLKEKGEEPDFEEPLILRKGSTVEDALEQLPGDMKERFKHARVSGDSSNFPKQKVGEEHELMDEDVLELNLRHL